VVEVGVAVQRNWKSHTAVVTYPTLQRREGGKRANFVIGGMDLAANGMTIDSLLQPDCPALVRLVLGGPLRRIQGQRIGDRCPWPRTGIVPACGDGTHRCHPDPGGERLRSRT
jgi:hypothetical protein